MVANELFFELIRVAIGNQDDLSHAPGSDEWTELYVLAKKQSLVGVCFAGIQRLNLLHSSNISNLPEILFLQWMGMAAKIQQRNESLDRRCAEVRERFTEGGFNACILKGQGIASLYGDLQRLRQSGDIDVWMWPDCDWSMSHDERVNVINEFLCSVGGICHTTYHNSSVKIFADTDVEAHYTPSWMYSPINNRRLQQWFTKMAPAEMKRAFSSVEFNMVYVLLHIYRHLFGEGIGLRQIVDYYFVLIHGQIFRHESLCLFAYLGVRKFVGAVMYIMESYLGLDKDYLLCEPDPKEGEFLLKEIMIAGNFGRHDERLNRMRARGLFAGFWMHVKRNMHFIMHYPSEVMWCPLWKVWHQLWLIRMKSKLKTL